MRATACVLAASVMCTSACATTSTTSTTSTTTTTSAGAATTTGSSSTASGLTETIGKFVWHDLVTDDLPAAREFYGTLLGWEFSEVTRSGKPYVIARNYGRLVAGLVAVDAAIDQEVSQWIGYQSVPNVDDAVIAVETSGGLALVGPTEVDSIGRAAVVTDPQGAPFGLLRLKGPDPADPPSPIEGAFFWMENLARDPAAAATFYTRTFGYQQQVTAQQGTQEYIVLSRGRARAGILQAPKPGMRPTWLPYVLVTDPAATAAKVAALGGTVLLEPRADVRKGSLAVVMDPSGAIVAFQKYPF